MATIMQDLAAIAALGNQARALAKQSARATDDHFWRLLAGKAAADRAKLIGYNKYSQDALRRVAYRALRAGETPHACAIRVVPMPDDVIVPAPERAA